MNQYLTENLYRRFPFRQDVDLPFGDTVVVDAHIILSTAFGDTAVRLELVTRSGSDTTFQFTISALDLDGYVLVGTVNDAAAENTRVLLQVEDLSAVPHPELGYGFMVIGSTVGLTGLGPSTVASADLDLNVIRVMRPNQTLLIRVANMTRPGASECSETAGDESVTSLLGRVATEVAGCVELTTEPDVDQVSADQDGNTSEVPIVPPDVTLTRYADGLVTTITTTAAAITDAIPTLPEDYDAVVDTGPVEVSPIIAGGHNVDLSGDFSAGQLAFNYRLGGGDGIDCDGVLGYDDLGRSAKECVKSLNGVHTLDGKLTLTAEHGLELLSDPFGHRIIILVNSEDLKRVTPA